MRVQWRCGHLASQRAQCLPLRRDGYVAFHCQMGQERDEFVGAHLIGRAPAMMTNEKAHPTYVRLLGARAVVSTTQDIAHALGKTPRCGRRVQLDLLTGVR